MVSARVLGPRLGGGPLVRRLGGLPVLLGELARLIPVLFGIADEGVGLPLGLDDLELCGALRGRSVVLGPLNRAVPVLLGDGDAGRAAGLEPGDWRAGDPDFTGRALSYDLAPAGALRPVAERHGVTPAAVAVAWTLSFLGVTGAIVGPGGPGKSTAGCPRRPWS